MSSKKFRKVFLSFSSAFLFLCAESQCMENYQGIDNLCDGKPVRLYRTNYPTSVSVSGEERSIYETPSNTQKGGEMKIVSDNSAGASFLLLSDRFPVQKGDLLIVKYGINIETGGRICLGFFSGNRSVWFGDTYHELKEGLQEGVFKTYVTIEDKEAMLVIRNWHLGTPGQSIFTIKNIEVKKVLGK